MLVLSGRHPGGQQATRRLISSWSGQALCRVSQSGFGSAKKGRVHNYWRVTPWSPYPQEAEGVIQRGKKGLIQRGKKGVIQRGKKGVIQRGKKGLIQRGKKGLIQRGKTRADSDVTLIATFEILPGALSGAADARALACC